MQRDDQQFHDIMWHIQNKRLITQFYRSCWHFLVLQTTCEFMRIYIVSNVHLSGRNLNCLFAFHLSLFYLKTMTNIFLSSHFEHSSSLLVTFLLSSVWKKVDNESSQVFPGLSLVNVCLWMADSLHHLLPPDRISVWRYQHLISPWQ